jgi:hypothetical protein
MASIGPSTFWPSPTAHGVSVAAIRNPANFFLAWQGQPEVQTQVAASEAGFNGMGTADGAE